MEDGDPKNPTSPDVIDDGCVDEFLNSLEYRAACLEPDVQPMDFEEGIQKLPSDEEFALGLAFEEQNIAHSSKDRQKDQENARAEIEADLAKKQLEFDALAAETKQLKIEKNRQEAIAK